MLQAAETIQAWFRKLRAAVLQSDRRLSLHGTDIFGGALIGKKIELLPGPMNSPAVQGAATGGPLQEQCPAQAEALEAAAPAPAGAEAEAGMAAGSERPEAEGE